MRTLTAGTNIEAPSTDYPKGRVKDANGGSGTIGNEVLFGDLIQFFQKLIIDAGITENGLPDNVNNGYQLLTALEQKVRSFASDFNNLGTVEKATTTEVLEDGNAKNLTTDNFTSNTIEITSFLNGYSQGSIYGKLKYRIVRGGKYIHIFGSVNVGTQQAVITILSSAIRPVGTDRKYFTVHGNDSSRYTMEIRDNGEMKFREDVGAVVLIDITYNIFDES